MKSWPEKPLVELADRIFVGIASAATHAYRESGVLLLRNLNIKEGGISRSDLIYIDPGYEKQHARKRLRAGDVLTVRTGYAGVSAVLPDDLIGAQCFTALVTRPNTEVLNSQFLAQFLNSPIGEKAFTKSEAGGSQKNVNAGALEELLIPIPPLHEQRLIAKILFAWDTTIQKSEQLIAAKERSSKALMQRIFASNDHLHLKLSEFICRVTRKNTEGNGHPLTISGAEGLVSQSRYFDKRIAAEKTEHYTLLKRGEYAYNKSYSAGYPLGAIKRLDAYDEGIVSTLYLCFSLDDTKAISSDYFAYFCEAGGFNHQIYRVAQEGARNHGLLNVAADDFFSMTMPVPPIDVQERAVKVMGAAMQELALLRIQLSALRKQKRGLMRKLLTGQWRLPIHQQTEVPTDA